MNYISFCKNFFGATNIPVSLLKNGQAQYSALGEMLSIPSQSYWELFSIDRNPVFCSYSQDIEYGLIHIDDTEYNIVIGPAFNVPVTDSIVRQFMRELMIPLDYREQLTECLAAIPRTSHLQFAKYLVFLYQCVNQKDIDFQEFYMEGANNTRERKERQVKDTTENMENDMQHNSYHFELELYQYIKEGNVNRLKEYLLKSRLLLKEGKMANSPIRHTKNIFITAAAKSGILGLIPGGVDVERAYQLMDFYIQECEQLQTIEEINNLQYMMMLDFCQRAGEVQKPEGISNEVYQCMNYIRSHTNETLSVTDVARHVHRSSSYMMKRFKEELGIHMGAFIMRCKLEEAKSLLTYSDKSLAEISSYLCFSSQSYFQNVFKKQYNITPMQYRKNTQKQ